MKIVLYSHINLTFRNVSIAYEALGHFRISDSIFEMMMTEGLAIHHTEILSLILRHACHITQFYLVVALTHSLVSTSEKISCTFIQSNVKQCKQ